MQLESVGLLTYKQLMALVQNLVVNAPEAAQIKVTEGQCSLVVNSARGKILSAIWRVKSQCSVRAVPGLVNKVIK